MGCRDKLAVFFAILLLVDAGQAEEETCSKCYIYALAGGAGTVALTPVALGALGFGAGGIAAGSAAAKLMSWTATMGYGGSVLASLQSAGAAGLGLKGTATIGTAALSFFRAMCNCDTVSDTNFDMPDSTKEDEKHDSTKEDEKHDSTKENSSAGNSVVVVDEKIINQNTTAVSYQTRQLEIKLEDLLAQEYHFKRMSYMEEEHLAKMENIRLEREILEMKLRAMKENN